MLFEKFSIKRYSDLELVAKYKENGKQIYFGELFERYSEFMFYVCLKYLRQEDKSKDAVMQIAEKLIEDLPRHNISNFKSWLHVVTKNFCLMQIRHESIFEAKQKSIDKNLIVLMENDAEMHHGNENVKEVNLELLEKALQELDDKQKRCIELFYLDEKSYVEISQITGFDLKSVKSYIQNGKRNLKILMEKFNEQ